MSNYWRIVQGCVKWLSVLCDFFSGPLNGHIRESTLYLFSFTLFDFINDWYYNIIITRQCMCVLEQGTNMHRVCSKSSYCTVKYQVYFTLSVNKITIQMKNNFCCCFWSIGNESDLHILKNVVDRLSMVLKSFAHWTDRF